MEVDGLMHRRYRERMGTVEGRRFDFELPGFYVRLCIIFSAFKLHVVKGPVLD